MAHRRRRGKSLESMLSTARSKAGQVIQKVLDTGTKVSDTLRKKICNGQGGSGIKQMKRRRSKRWGRSLVRDIPLRGRRNIKKLIGSYGDYARWVKSKTPSTLPGYK